jgi:hypothetical protein
MSLTRSLPRFGDSRFEASAAAAVRADRVWRILLAAGALLAIALDQPFGCGRERLESGPARRARSDLGRARTG